MPLPTANNPRSLEKAPYNDEYGSFLRVAFTLLNWENSAVDALFYSVGRRNLSDSRITGVFALLPAATTGQ